MPEDICEIRKKALETLEKEITDYLESQNEGIDIRLDKGRGRPKKDKEV